MVLDMVTDIFENGCGNGRRKPFRWILLDSAIVAGIAALAALPESRLPTLTQLYIAIKAFLYAFLVQLAAELGIRPMVENGRRRSNNKGRR